MSTAKGHWSKENAFAAVNVPPNGMIGLALANDEMIRDGAPFSYITARRGNQWGDGGGVAFDSVALASVHEPRQQFVLVGPMGQVYVTGSGDRHEEEIIDRTFSPKTLGFIRDARTIDGKVFACGMKRQVYRRDDADHWTCISQNIAGGTGVHGFEALDGFSRNDLYAVGWSGEIWHFDGGDLRQCDSPCSDLLVDVCCAGDGLVYAIARGTTLVSGRAAPWSARSTELPVELLSLCWFKDRLYGASTRDVFVLDHAGAFVPVAIGPDFPATCGELATNGDILVSAGARDVFSFDGVDWRRID